MLEWIFSFVDKVVLLAGKVVGGFGLLFADMIYE